MEQEWISVENKVPPYSVRVIVLLGNTVLIAERKSTNVAGENWLFEDSNPTYYAGKRPTYWMPLPKPPIK